jgi:hypothetical protein
MSNGLTTGRKQQPSEVPFEDLYFGDMFTFKNSDHFYIKTEGLSYMVGSVCLKTGKWHEIGGTEPVLVLRSPHLEYDL